MCILLSNYQQGWENPNFFHVDALGIIFMQKTPNKTV